MARIILLALVLSSAVGGAGCGGAVGSQADLPFRLFREEGLGGDAASLVVIVSPFSCGLFGADLRRIRALGNRISLTLAFVADKDSPSDSIQVAKTALSFGLGNDVSYVIVNEAEYRSHLSAPLGLRMPVFLLSRRYATVAAFSNLDPRHALTAIEAILKED